LSILFATAATLLLVVGMVLVPILVEQASSLITNLPTYAEGLADKAGINDEDVRQEIRDKGEALMRDPVTALSYLWDGVASSVGMLTGVVGTATSIAMGLGLFPVYLFVFLWHWPAIEVWPVDYIPASRRARCLSMAGKMDQAIGGYFRTRLVIASVMGVLYSCGWGIAGVPYWLLIGMLGGLLGIVPYASGLAWLAAMLLRYLNLENGMEGTGDVLAVFLWPTIVYALVQESDDWIMTPLLQGNQLNMSFITIILAVFVGAAVAGLFGMFMAVPAAACIQIYWTESLSPRLKGFAESS
jgi:predicted PurR-regulated permease PerM